MLKDERDNLAAVLQNLADTLDIPDYAYEDACLKYEEVGEHLAADDSDLRLYNPSIYAQGSFRLGTAVQPFGRSDEFDIDLVCQLEIRKESISQRDLKSKIGKRLEESEVLSKIIEASRRCWVLNYPGEPGMFEFHMDVLPSIPNLERTPTGILLTDTELRMWQKSNPLAYAEWFKGRMEVVFRVRKAALAESLAASIEEVPDWRVKTPLQRCIQILKRHRDVYFERKPELRPVSIILTTLAAHAYANEEEIFNSLIKITEKMPNFIESRKGVWWVENPVESEENFADKWNQYPERREAFLAWLQKVKADFANLEQAESVSKGLDLLDAVLGKQMMDKVAARMQVKRGNYPAVAHSIGPVVPKLADSSHAMAPTSEFQLSVVPEYFVRVSAGVYFKNGDKKGRFLWTVRNKSVPKNVWIKFRVKTNAPEPYSIRWQVVNTGDEAVLAKQPRGDFYDADNQDKNVRWESTAYRGTHWVEAFVVNSSGVCVSRSGKFYVMVR